MVKTIPAISLALAVSFAPSCKKDDGTKKEPAGQETDSPKTEEPVAKTADKPGLAKASDSDVAAAIAVMTPYEACRETLAADDGDVVECARQIAEAAAKATGGVAADAMKEIGGAAAALADVPGEDIEAVRLAFGKVSKPIEVMLTAIPLAAAKYKMYECPMAKGFTRWAQPISSDKVAMANPYMGTKMLECGSEVHDHHKGAMKNDTKHDDMKHGDMKHGDMKHDMKK